MKSPLGAVAARLQNMGPKQLGEAPRRMVVRHNRNSNAHGHEKPVVNNGRSVAGSLLEPCGGGGFMLAR